MYTTETTPTWPAVASVWHVEDWTKPKVIRTFAKLDDAKGCAEMLIREQIGDLHAAIDWRNECFNCEGCEACYRTGPHPKPQYVDGIWMDPKVGPQVADFRLVEVVVYEGRETGGLIAA